MLTIDSNCISPVVDLGGSVVQPCLLFGPQDSDLIVGKSKAPPLKTYPLTHHSIFTNSARIAFCTCSRFSA